MSAEPTYREKMLAQNVIMGTKAWADPALGEPRLTATPQEMYVKATSQCPVADLGDGFYRVLAMEDVLYLNKHPKVEQGSKFLGSDRPAIPLGLDGPEHRKFRRLLDPVFAAKRIAPLADQIRDLAGTMIDGFLADGQVNAYAEWAEPLPSTIFLSVMGLPMDDLENFLHFKRLTLSGGAGSDLTAEEQIARATEAVMWIHNYFNNALEERSREAEPREDMIGWLMTTEIDGERINREDLLAILGLLMIAGLDTVAASLACFLSYFARNPDRRAEVVANPSLLRGAVEELMRFESPVTEGFRLVMQDVTVPSGTTIPAGSVVLISWSGANVDPTFWANPLEVDFHRSPNPHIGFASGFHRCLGSHLARMEMEIALAVWHSKIPNYSLAPGTTLHYTGNPRAPHSLPLVW